MGKITDHVIQFFLSRPWPIDFEDPLTMAEYQVTHYKEKVADPPLGELMATWNAECSLEWWEIRLKELQDGQV